MTVERVVQWIGYGAEGDALRALMVAIPLAAALRAVSARRRGRVLVGAGLGAAAGVVVSVVGQRLALAPWSGAQGSVTSIGIVGCGTSAALFLGAVGAVVAVVRAHRRGSGGQAIALAAAMLLGFGAPFGFRVAGMQLHWPIFPVSVGEDGRGHTISYALHEAVAMGSGLLAVGLVTLGMVVLAQRVRSVRAGVGAGAAVVALLAGGRMVRSIHGVIRQYLGVPPELPAGPGPLVWIGVLALFVVLGSVGAALWRWDRGDRAASSSS